ncbi:hypothetical protein QAD02_009105, partial [Eretmocerus hayati]
GYQTSNHNATLGRGITSGMSLVNDGEVVVFDDIDDNWQDLRLELGSSNTTGIMTASNTLPSSGSLLADNDDLLLLHQQQQQHQQQSRTPPSSSLCSSPSPTTTYHRNTSDFFKVITPASECEDFTTATELNHKQHPQQTSTRLIGELPIAQYSSSPRRYGTRENVRLPTLLSSPSSVYVAPRPGFPQRVLPVTPNHKENNEDASSEIVVENNAVIEPSALVLDEPLLLGTSVTTTVSSAAAASSPLSPATSTASPKLMLSSPTEVGRDSPMLILGSSLGTLTNAMRRNNDISPKPFADNNLSSLESLGGSTFDYLYEFSETRKVLEEFFKCPAPSEDKNVSETFPFQDLDYELRRQGGSAYVGQRLATVPSVTEEVMVHESPKKYKPEVTQVKVEHENNFLDLSVGTGSSEDLGETEVGLQVGHSRNFTLSPETTECDSNCGDLDSEMSLMMMDNEMLPASGLLGSVGDLGNNSDSLRIYTSMPVLEDGLSSGHASDTDNNNPTVMLMKRQINEIEKEIIQRTRNDMLGTDANDNTAKNNVSMRHQAVSPEIFITKKENSYDTTSELQLDGLDPLGTPPPPAPQSRQSSGLEQIGGTGEVEAAIKDIRMALQRTKTLPLVKSPTEEPPEPSVSPIWIPSLLNGRRRIYPESNSDSEARRNADDADVDAEEAADEEEADTDLETDRLLGQQRTDDQGFYDDKGWRKPRTRTLLPSTTTTISSKASERGKLINSSGVTPTAASSTTTTSSNSATTPLKPNSLALHESLVSSGLGGSNEPSTSSGSPPQQPQQQQQGLDATSSGSEAKLSSPPATKNGIGIQIGAGQTSAGTSPPNAKNSPSTPHSLKDQPVSKDKEGKKKNRNKEDLLDDPTVLIEGVLFRARYLGSTQLACEGQPTKSTRMCQAEEAVSRIKAPDGESQPSTEVDLFISTEKIMVLNTDLKEIMMDHALRTISYIADIGDLVVLMARRRFVPHEMDEVPKNRTPKMICHVFESEEAQFIAQSIGQAFQVAYMEFLKANGIEDHSFVKEMDYQEVLNSQEIFGDELQMFAKKEMQKEVVVPKAKGEILGVVIVESGWGSMLPTVVIANLAPAGAAARCGQLNIGDQIIAINGVSLVGLPLSTCQTYIKNSKNQTVVKLTVVPCAPVVEVKIKRPDTKYQLGFSVQNGVICSLLRGGIAERGGVRVGHRIIEINNQSVVAVPHEKIVNLLATSVGEILMKTMPTSMFRLLTGQESPVYI